MIGKIEKKLIFFGVSTWIISWTLWYGSGVLGRNEDFVYDKRWLIAQIGVFAPSLSALLISSFRDSTSRYNSIRIFFLFIPVFLGGYFISVSVPHSIKEFSPVSSAIILLLGLLTSVFFSSWNRRLYIPSTGEIPGKAQMKYKALAILGMPLLFMACWILTCLNANDFSISSLDEGPGNFIRILFTAFFMNLIFGGSLGEEIGWRGFALPLLLKKYAPLQASFILGVAWAFWHLPVDISGVGMSPLQAIIARFTWTLPLTVVFTWFYINTGGNLLIPILLHTSVNVLPDLGFSNYEKTMGLFTLAIIIVSFVLLRAHRMQ